MLNPISKSKTPFHSKAMTKIKSFFCKPVITYTCNLFYILVFFVKETQKNSIFSLQKGRFFHRSGQNFKIPFLNVLHKCIYILEPLHQAQRLTNSVCTSFVNHPKYFTLHLFLLPYQGFSEIHRLFSGNAGQLLYEAMQYFLYYSDVLFQTQI